MAMLFSCENDMRIVNSIVIDEESPISTTYDSKSIITDSGKVRVIMKSPVAEHYIKDIEYIELPKGIDVTFFDSTGAVSSTITSNYAISNQKSMIMKAKNDVVATNRIGQKLYTEELIWDQKKKRIYTEVDVRVVTEDKVLLGDGLEADEEFDEWTILNPRGDIMLKNEEDSL
jgi:LPS export ABC transporter protein LptC